MSISIQQCMDCATLLFPARLRCPNCGSAALAPATAAAAVVEQVTTLADGTRLATLRHDGGPALIARLTGGGEPGDELPLTSDPQSPPGYAYVPAMTTGEESLEEESR